MQNWFQMDSIYGCGIEICEGSYDKHIKKVSVAM